MGREQAVGVVAPMLAAIRAAAATAGLIDEPFAAPLVRAAGLEFPIRVADGELDLDQLGGDGGFPRLAELFAARTRFFDTFLADGVRSGIRQLVILGSGLESRGYRLWWPAGTTLYEVDQPRLIEAKTATMRSLGVTPSVNRRAVGIGLDGDWPAALHRVGFAAAAPTGWMVEGLLIGFVPADIQDQLLDNITRLSAAGSRLAVDHLVPVNRAQAAHAKSLAAGWRRRGLDVDLAGVFAPDARNHVPRYLTARGWSTAEFGMAELFAAARRPPLSAADLDGAPAAIGYLTAARTSGGGPATLTQP